MKNKFLLKVKYKKKANVYVVYLNNQVLLQQKVLFSKKVGLTNKQYTFLYVLKALRSYGFVSPLVQ